VRLTLLVPELIWPEPADQRTLGKLPAPGFEWLAAHAEFRRQPRQAFENALARQFGIENPPFGPLRLLGEPLKQTVDEGYWLCADPVHLRFHHERIILADAGAFELDEAESRAIVSALNAEFADIGQFHVATARRWYLRLNVAVDHFSEPISAVAGRLVDSEITDKTGVLTRWLNEVQMFLHGHPVNERRQAEGKPAINSLWLWGAGDRTPHDAPANFSGIRSNNPLAIGLARACQLPVQPCPDKLADLLDGKESNVLVVLNTLLPPVLYEDSDGWREQFQALESNWFSPLRKALGRRIDTLNIVAPTIYGELSWQLQGRDRWKLWRKSRPLADIATELAEGKGKP
jgi:hypothetical protein